MTRKGRDALELKEQNPNLRAVMPMRRRTSLYSSRELLDCNSRWTRDVGHQEFIAGIFRPSWTANRR